MGLTAGNTFLERLLRRAMYEESIMGPGGPAWRKYIDELMASPISETDRGDVPDDFDGEEEEV